MKTTQTVEKNWPVIFACSLAVLAALLFSRLGHYALWGDEAYTALFAKAIQQTGDTTALIDGGKNIITAMAGWDGRLLVGLHERSNAPLPAYLIAAGTGLFGQNAGAARLLPTLLGFLALALLLWQTRRLQHGAWWCALLALGFACNASLLLFLQQARYFGPAAFFTTVVALVYLRKDISRWQALGFALATVGFYLTHYMMFAVFFATLAVDYFVFKWRGDNFSIKRMFLLLAPPAAVCVVLLWLLNPLKTEWMGSTTGDGLAEKLQLWWWQWRDMNACEFVPLLMLALTLGCALWFKDRWLWRGLTAVFVFVLTLTVITPQVVKNNTTVADVRYLVPILPLVIILSARAIWLIVSGRPLAALLAGAAVFGTGWLSGNWLDGDFRPAIVKYLGELARPNPEPFTPTAEWLKKNVPDNATVWVVPNENVAPLLFINPAPVYAWGLSYPPRKPQFANLSPAFFMGVIPPDYVVCFGPVWPSVMNALGKAGLTYQPAATLDYFWKDLYRPEIFWRRFDPIENYRKDTQAVYIFKRVDKTQEAR